MTNKPTIPQTAKKTTSGAKVTVKTPAYFSFDIEVSPFVQTTDTKQNPAEDIIIAEHTESGYTDYKTGETDNEMIIRFTGESYTHIVEDKKTKAKMVEHSVKKKQGNWYSVSLSLPMLKKYFPAGKFSILIMPKDGLSPIPLYTGLNSNNPSDVPPEADLGIEEGEDGNSEEAKQ